MRTSDAQVAKWLIGYGPLNGKQSSDVLHDLQEARRVNIEMRTFVEHIAEVGVLGPNDIERARVLLAFLNHNYPEPACSE